MKVIDKDVVVIGGGPAGLAAAAELRRQGIHDVLILERERHLGGILRQCIHDGFGLTRFGEALSGPEYARRFIDDVIRLRIPCQTDTTVISLTKDRLITTTSSLGMQALRAKAVALAMGCRERNAGNLAIPGDRPSGVMTAGMAQCYLNLYNLMVGREVVILGSGDIGLIMARRLTLEGAHVKAVLEINNFPGGLQRNIKQCLDDFGIPLYLSHTVTSVHGGTRLSGVTVSRVDDDLKPIEGTQREWTCDTLILSVGLIPENELSREAGAELDEQGGLLADEFCQTSVKGIFAAGNVMHVHDVVDFVSLEAEAMARAIYKYLTASEALPDHRITIRPAIGVGSVVPRYISGLSEFRLSVRVKQPKENARIEILSNGRSLYSKRLTKALPSEMIILELPPPGEDCGDMEVYCV